MPCSFWLIEPICIANNTFAGPLQAAAAEMFHAALLGHHVAHNPPVALCTVPVLLHLDTPGDVMVSGITLVLHDDTWQWVLAWMIVAPDCADVCFVHPDV